MDSGVYVVNIDQEQQKVTVSGIVDSCSLIKKLAKSGKYAEMWSSIPNTEQTHLVDNHSYINSPQSQRMQSLIQDFRGPNRAQTEHLRNFDQRYLNQQQGMEIEENLDEGEDGQNNLHLEWDDQMLAPSNGNNSMTTDMDMDRSLVVAERNEIGGLHNLYSGVPLSYRTNYNPSMMMMPNTLGYPYNHYPSPMRMNATWRNTNMMVYDGGYNRHRPQNATGFHTPASQNYY